MAALPNAGFVQAYGMTELGPVQYCRLHMAGYKVPRSIAFVDGLPLSPAGKVQKNVLRDMAVQEKW